MTMVLLDVMCRSMLHSVQARKKTTLNDNTGLNNLPFGNLMSYQGLCVMDPDTDASDASGWSTARGCVGCLAVCTIPEFT